MTYVPLAVRTEYSFLDGMCRVDALVERARGLRFDAVGIADLHGTFGLVKFYVAARAAGIRPLLGARVRILPDAPSTESWSHTRPEVTLLASDAHGYRNLLRLVSLAHLENGSSMGTCAGRDDSEAGVTLDDLQDFHAGIVALDGGFGGPVSRAFLQGRSEDAERIAGRLRETFGAERFFMQLQRHGAREENMVETFIVRLARALNVPIVAANEVRYLDADDATAYDVLRCTVAGRLLSDPSRPYVRPNQHLQSDVEMQRLFRELPEALTNTHLVAERCQLDLDLGVNHIPTFVPQSGREAHAELRYQCERGICERFGIARYQDAPVAARDRIAHELAVIEEKKLASCFLTVQDVVRYAKEEGIPVGPGRGNVAGSLVAFALGITDIDPLVHGLYFQPLLSRGRRALPELDLDVGHRGRERLTRYVRTRHGSERTALLAIVPRRTPAAAVKQAAEALGCPESTLEPLLPALRSGTNGTLQDALERSSRLRVAYQKSVHVRRAVDVARRLEGLAQPPGPNAGALLLAAESLGQHVALQRATSGELVAQTTAAEADVLGLMQIHLHGLRYLSVQQDALERIDKRTGAPPVLRKLAVDDEPVYRMLAQGGAQCVFQLEGTSMQALLRDLQPAQLEDLIAALSLNRPAARASGMLERFLERRRAAPMNTSGVPGPAAAAKQGLVLHGEQIMQIALDVAGYTLEEAEDLRSIVVRRGWQELTRHRSKFLSGALEGGLELPRAEELFDYLAAVGGTVDSRAHNTSYALLTYWSAYLATHHALEYTAAVLDSCVGQTERLERILAEGIDRHVAIRDVDINRSASLCRLEGDAIRLGLAHVRRIGESTAEHVVVERELRGDFKSLADFERRLPEVPRRTLESLVRAGAFESLHVGRGEKLGLPHSGRTRRATRTAAQLELDLGLSERDGVSSDGGSEEPEDASAGADNGGATAESKPSPGTRGMGSLPLLAGDEPGMATRTGRPAGAKRRAARRVTRTSRATAQKRKRWVEKPNRAQPSSVDASRVWVVGQIPSRH